MLLHILWRNLAPEMLLKCISITYFIFPSLVMGLRDVSDFTAIIPISVVHTVSPRLNIPFTTSISNGASSNLFPFGMGPRDLGRSTVLSCFSKGSPLSTSPFLLRDTSSFVSILLPSSESCTEGGGVVGGGGGGGGSSSSCPSSTSF